MEKTIERIFTAIHEHRFGTTVYVFRMAMPPTSPTSPGNWIPSDEEVIEALDIEFDEDREESLEIECQSLTGIEGIPTVPFKD